MEVCLILSWKLIISSFPLFFMKDLYFVKDRPSFILFESHNIMKDLYFVKDRHSFILFESHNILIFVDDTSEADLTLSKSEAIGGPDSWADTDDESEMDFNRKVKKIILDNVNYKQSVENVQYKVDLLRNPIINLHWLHFTCNLKLCTVLFCL